MTITINSTPEGLLAFDLRDDGCVWCSPLAGYLAQGGALYDSRRQQPERLRVQDGDTLACVAVDWCDDRYRVLASIRQHQKQKSKKNCFIRLQDVSDRVL